MKLSPALKPYTEETRSAKEAQRLAEFIAWGPIVFQASRLMVKFGILSLLRESEKGLTRADICRETKLSDYAVGPCLSTLKPTAIRCRKRVGFCSMTLRHASISISITM